MKTIVTIVGARPQFVKMGPLSRALRGRFREIVVHTGQHYDRSMSGDFFDELGLPRPGFMLGVGGGSHGRQTGRILEATENVLEETKPDVVIVFGDTNSTLAGALAAVKMGIRTVHVEAGLRSRNRAMPEEINRVLADHAADRLFAPTRSAMVNLDREGLGSRAVLTGDIMVDAVRENRERALARPAILEDLDLEKGGYSLLTLHRPYTVDDPERLGGLLSKLDALDEPILFPVHPRTRKTLERMDGGSDLSTNSGNGVATMTGTSIRTISPVGYLDSLLLQDHARRIFTDSGGVQKEAYILGKPCVTIRPETEWVETVEAGWNLLLSPDDPDLTARIRRFNPAGERPPVFGENIAERMVAELEEM